MVPYCRHGYKDGCFADGVKKWGSDRLTPFELCLKSTRKRYRHDGHTCCFRALQEAKEQLECTLGHVFVVLCWWPFGVVVQEPKGKAEGLATLVVRVRRVGGGGNLRVNSCAGYSNWGSPTVLNMIALYLTTVDPTCLFKGLNRPTLEPLSDSDLERCQALPTPGCLRKSAPAQGGPNPYRRG